MRPDLYGRTLMTQSRALIAVSEEVARARTKHGGIASPHEAIAVIREEYLEAERAVFARRCDRYALHGELVQLAAMCVRAIEDLGLAPPADGCAHYFTDLGGGRQRCVRCDTEIR